MTDPAEPTDPTERLRRDLAAFAAAVTPTDGLDQLARHLGHAPATDPSAPPDAATTADAAATPYGTATPDSATPLDLGAAPLAGRPGRRPTRVLAVAAVVAALVAGAALAVRGTRSGTEGTAATGAEATGWFAPVAGEPARWALDTAEAVLVDPATEPVVQVRLTFTDAEGVSLALRLQPAGTATTADLLGGEGLEPPDTYLPMRIGTPALAVDRLDADGRLVGLTCAQADGTWHDMDLVVIGCSGDERHPDADPLASLVSFVEALRPVDASWRSLVAPSVPAGSPLLAPTYREAADRILHGDDTGVATTAPSPRVTTPTTPTTGRTNTTDASGPDAPEGPDALRPQVTGGQFDDLRGLTFALAPEATTVAAGRPLSLTLRVTNTTDEPRELTECTVLLTATGLVPADDAAAPVPQPMLTDCYRTTTTVVPAGATVTFPLGREQLAPWARTPGRGLLGRSGGALTPGRYLLTAVVPGRHDPARVQVPVTVTEPPCPGFTDELVERLRDLPEADARAALAPDRELRVVERAGVGRAVNGDLRCDRVDASLDARGHVWDVVGVG